MFRKLFTLILVASTITTVSCAGFVVGAGVGAGTYTYIKGELKRSYQAPFDTTITASTAALASCNIVLLENNATGLQTKLVGERSDGTPVTVTVEMSDPNVTAVSIRSGVVGYWDRSGSEQIHATIAQKLH